MSDPHKLSAVKAVFLDMDGTIYHGSKLYPTTLPFLNFLKKHNIRVSWDLKVPRILNRDRSGLCPLEKSVEKINDPVEAQKALEAKIRQMMKKR